MATLKLEVGKSYRDRDGNKHGPMRLKDDPSWHKFTDGRLSWGASGGSLSTGGEFPNDLIAEWTDAPTGPVRTVTRKEIVPGTYSGGVTVVPSTDMSGEGRVSIATALGRATATELRAAIATLTEIADALEEQA